MRRRTVIGTGLATAGAAAVGGIASGRGVRTWYPTLNKPGYVPPNAVFPFAWTVLYTGIAVTSAASLDVMRANNEKRVPYSVALGANLVLNASWSWLFFGLHKLGPAALVAGALTLSGTDLTRRTARVNRGAGLALSSYPAWCAFATVLSTDIWWRNR